jgi:hypothetical protein
MKMVKKDRHQSDERANETAEQIPGYAPPKIVTYTSEQILEEIGPAQACSPSPDPWG